MTLAEAERRYRELYLAHRSSEKASILRACFSTYRPVAIKYFVKVITGNLRIGLMVKQVEEAVAAATGVSSDDVRSANNRLGSLPAVALVARTGQLNTIEARLFRPMEFMLAKPLDALSDAGDASEYLVEDKYDGIRSQAHIANGRAVIYTRGLDEATAAFPEVERALLELPVSGILDGETLAWSNGRPAPFTVLQQRTGRKMAPVEIMRKIPVAFMAYDILYWDGELLIDRPLEDRRRLLEQTIGGRPFPLLISVQYEAVS